MKFFSLKFRNVTKIFFVKTFSDKTHIMLVIYKSCEKESSCICGFIYSNYVTMTSIWFSLISKESLILTSKSIDSFLYEGNTGTYMVNKSYITWIITLHFPFEIKIIIIFSCLNKYTFPIIDVKILSVLAYINVLRITQFPKFIK